MPSFTCPNCQESFNVPATSSSARGMCPHCRAPVALPQTPASRWYYARNKKKHGPYTWEQLVTLAQRGEFSADDMLLQEGAKKWVRAGTLPALFGATVPVAKPAAPRPARRLFPWLIVAACATGACLLVSVISVGYYFATREKSVEPQIVEVPKKEVDKPPPKKIIDPPKNDDKKPPDKKPPDKAPLVTPKPDLMTPFVERLNRQRKSAGLGAVTRDDDLCRGCIAHAKYLAANVPADMADASTIYDEDAKKPGFSVEGQQAGQNAMIAYADPLDALDQWFGRLAGRSALLAHDMQTIGLGIETNAAGDVICVLDPVRGRRAPIVVFPAPKQADVPLSFTSGPEAPDAKAAAGFPVTVTFPPAQEVSDVTFELRDDQKQLVNGWLWTPQKPAPGGRQHNSIAMIPKGLLRSNTTYQINASAKVGGKPWKLDWSFTTDDDVDRAGAWAKKSLALVNAYRARAGLKPVEIDERLSRGCLAHAHYLVINEGHPALDGLSAHHEDPKLPGYSAEGDAAGKASNIATGDNEPTDGVNGWMATLYHRTPLLEPGLKTIGFGCARGRRQGWVTVMHVNSVNRKEAHSGPVLYPVPDQIDVPLSFPNGGEEPNPIPEDKSGKAGYPITAYFIGSTPKNANAKLTDPLGNEIPCWFSSPEKLANPSRPQGNVICLIPKAPLAPEATYRVEMQAQLAGKAWEMKWKFITGKGGPTIAEATKTVLDRLNHYRNQAGLPAVTLDDKLSYGCQRHAEYLVKNAAIIAKKNASVNDEDANLPGFSRDGLQAAQSSDVFSDAPTPVTQIDDLMATFSRRVYLLEPSLQRIGFGCYHDVGKGWRCVLDVNRGLGSSAPIVLYPGPKQADVPTTGFDRIDGIKGRPGYPISVMFPPQSNLKDIKVVLADAEEKEVPFYLAKPDKRGLLAIYPTEPLLAGRTYSVTVSVIVNGAEWRQMWQFTTGKAM